MATLFGSAQLHFQVMAAIVSWLKDNSVRVWDALTGREELYAEWPHLIRSTQLHFQVMAATLSLAQVTIQFGCGMP
jgi:hypothetical protein